MLQYYVDYTKKPRTLRLFLLNSRGTTLCELHDSFNKKQTIKFNDINQLSFTIPYFVDVEHRFQKNPLIKQFTKKNRIRAVIYNHENKEVYEEEYVLTKKSKSANDTSIVLNVECYGRGYELRRNKIIGYEVTSYTCSQVIDDCLKGTGWSKGYVSAEFDKLYRSFEISSNTSLEFLNEIATTFGAVITYDTINKLVNFYKEEEISTYKGFWVSQDQYILNIEESIDEDDIITRLFVTGADDLTINGVNPTGQSYIDDFSYFYDVMSESLKNALIGYNEKLEANKTTLSGLLNSKKSLQQQLTSQQNILTNLQFELEIILDNLEVAKKAGDSTSSLTAERNAKKAEISTQQSIVNSISNQISAIGSNSTQIASILTYESNLTNEQLSELEDYISVDEWSDSNIDDEQTLMDEARKYLTEHNSPPINVTMNILNFFNIITEQYNWDRFNIGDIIRIEHDSIGTFVEAKVQEFTIDYENDSIDVSVTNTKRVANDVQQWIEDNFRENKKTKVDYYYNKAEIATAITNFNSRNDRIGTTPAIPIFASDGSDITHTSNDDGSANITVSWSFTESDSNAHNIDGFEIFFYSSNLSDDYVFGSTIASEEKVIASYSTRTLAFNSKAANKYHSFGIRAYRDVDPDINPTRKVYSEIINFPSSPYRPSEEVLMNGTLSGYLTGKVNNTTYITSEEEPTNAEVKQTVWINPATKEIKLRGIDSWETTSAGNSSSVGGYVPSEDNTPNTIVVRSETGLVNADINGDAQTLNGKSATDFIDSSNIGIPSGIATLDETGNIPSANLDNTHKYAFGTYIGDGTLNKLIPLNFTPSIVKIYTTDSTDNSIFLPSTLGGFLMSTNTNFYLSGVNNTYSLEYGQLTENGFFTGNDANTYGNKLSVSYFWEAYYIPNN